MTDYLQVTTTVENREDAERIARSLVEGRLAACVQVVGPISSTYWWQGEVQTAGEWLCVAKTRRCEFSRVEDAIRTLHSYETPEIIATAIAAGSPDYLEWLSDELAPSG